MASPALLLAALLLVACGSSGGSTSTAAPVASGPTLLLPCQTPDLAAKIQSATATNTVVSLTVTGSRTCVLEGYARPELVDAGGVVLPAQFTRLTDVPARRLTLKPGEMAVFELHARKTAANGGACTLVSPARLRITPPDQPDALTVDAPGAGALASCDGQYGLTAMQTPA